MKKGILMMVIMAALFFAPRAFAKGDVWEAAESDQYGTKAGGMLGRGLLNVATCFVDIIVQTVEKTQDGPPFVGTMTGLGSGLGCTALRVSSGALDVVTFWVPGFNGMPVAKSYSDCLDFEGSAKGAGTASQPMAVVSNEPAATPPAAAPPAEEPKPIKKHNPYDYVKK